MIKMVIGLFLLLGTLTRDNFGFIPLSDAQSFGYNFSTILILAGGFYLLYLGNKDRLKK